MAVPTSAALEAILFASGEPMLRKRLADVLGITLDALNTAAQELSRSLQGRGITLIETRDELELRTAPEASDVVQKLRESELSRDLGKASLEALAIILYRDGATRGEIDWIRGVNSTAAIRSLLLRGLIERTEDAVDKRRARYQLTIDALAHLGVSRKEDLPRYEEFTQELRAQQEAQEAVQEES